MAFGFTAINDDHVVQLDDKYRTWHVVHQQSFYGQGANGEQTIAVTCSPDTVIGVSPSLNAAFHIRATHENGVLTAKVSLLIGDASGFAHVFFFDNYGHNPAGENFGMEIFNAAGETVWHSSDRPLRITQYDPSRTLAIIPLNAPILIQESGNPNGLKNLAWYRAFWNGSSAAFENLALQGTVQTDGAVQWGYSFRSQIPYNGQPVKTEHFKYLLADVTGYV
ncbi:hypothetical protein [Martelella mediterranea]|uniref:Uncharacterized protein n=1 Tax=Martelella mediterranea TaxID=293089 RepID=A0A4R3NCK0_9HYPH|nr:hypothetical protein [Martelella mediterranea]TCT28156.1 hypothetical protein EDC90_10664 [Martelella mediterranea]